MTIATRAAAAKPDTLQSALQRRKAAGEAYYKAATHPRRIGIQAAARELCDSNAALALIAAIAQSKGV